MSSRDILEIEKRRHKLFEEFLTTVGRKKGGVFRDIVIEQDYDPFQAQVSNIFFRFRPIFKNCRFNYRFHLFCVFSEGARNQVRCSRCGQKRPLEAGKEQSVCGAKNYQRTRPGTENHRN
jgi:hypothetical protein